MTIVTTTSRVSYVGNGSTFAFTVPWRVLDASFLLVQKVVTATGAVTTLALNTDYTVSGVTNPSATLTTAVAPLATETLVISVNVPLTQTADYVPGDEFPAETHEAALDKLTLIAQQLSATTTRNVRAPATDAFVAELPSAVARANKFLRFDANGDPSIADSQIPTIYYGAANSDPLTRPDGSARQAGDLYFNTTSNVVRVFSGSAWQNAVPSSSITLVNYAETSATAKTTFTIAGGYTVGTVFIYLNGVLLEPSEYTASNGSTVVLGAACAVGDEFRCVGFPPLSIADTLARSQSLADVPDKAAARSNLGLAATAGNVVLARNAATAGDFAQVALAASQLLGRGATGDISPITLGAGLSMVGTALTAATVGVIDYQAFANPGAGTWTKPAGAGGSDLVLVTMWAAGGGGAATQSGGGGGAFSFLLLAAGALPATLSVSIGAGGAVGAAGGNTSFGPWSVFGGGAGSVSGGGGGGGWLSAGGTGPGAGGGPLGGAAGNPGASSSGMSGGGGSNTSGATGGNSVFGGGGGSIGGTGGLSFYGGGGGGATGGTSQLGGAGGGTGVAGSQPGGGGGINAAGGNGLMRVWTLRVG